MILFGKNKGFASSLKKGDFHCPNCESNQSFELKRVRKFFTLYHVPIIPLAQLGDYVECLACRDTYKPKVLDPGVDLSKEEFEAEYHPAIKEVMIRMLLADRKIRESEVEMIQTIYEKITRKSISKEVIKLEVHRIESTSDTLKDSLLRLQGNLNDEGKELVIQAAFYVAMADEDFHEHEQEYLSNIGTDLGMTPAHFQGVISTA
jgi:tellurite resistance protein